MIKTVLVSSITSAIVVAAGLYAYHQRVVGPSQIIGVVDVAQIFRDKEREATATLTKAGLSEADRQQAMLDFTKFASELPRALGDLSSECGCRVFLRTAVVGDSPGTIDLTESVRTKLGIKG